MRTAAKSRAIMNHLQRVAHIRRILCDSDHTLSCYVSGRYCRCSRCLVVSDNVFNMKSVLGKLKARMSSGGTNSHFSRSEQQQRPQSVWRSGLRKLRAKLYPDKHKCIYSLYALRRRSTSKPTVTLHVRNTNRFLSSD